MNKGKVFSTGRKLLLSSRVSQVDIYLLGIYVAKQECWLVEGLFVLKFGWPLLTPPEASSCGV